MDHHRALRLIVLDGVGDIEALGHEEVDLTGTALPGATEGIGDVEVDLRAVEGAVAGIEGVLAPLALEPRAQRVPGLPPLLPAPDRFLRPSREPDGHPLKAEAGVELVNRLADPGPLVDDLL